MWKNTLSPDGRILLITLNVLCLGLMLGIVGYSWLVFQPVILGAFPHNHMGIPLLPETCLFKHITSYPCAGCGMTRAMVLITHGEFSEAFRFHPLSIPLFWGVLSFMTISLIWPRKVLRGLHLIGVSRILLLIVLAMLIAWAFKLAGPSLYW